MNKELTLQMKELVNKARERGKITPVAEAFKKYPVEDELSEEDYAELESGKYKLKMSGRELNW